MGPPSIAKMDFGKGSNRITRSGKLAYNEKYAEIDGYYVEVSARSARRVSEPKRFAQTFVQQNESPTWSPDGKRVAYIRNEKLICIQTVATGKVEVVDPGMNRINHLYWSADGKWMALGPYGPKAFGLHAFNLETLELKSLVWLKHDLKPGESDIKFMHGSADGTSFIFRVYPADKPRYRAVNLATRVQTEIRFDETPEKIEYYGLSPDGSRIAYVVQKTPNGPVELLVADRDFRNAATIARLGVIPKFGTTPGRNDSGVWPRWSPDGRMLAYFRNPAEGNEKLELHVVAADGSWDETINPGTLKHRWARTAPEWSPDGTKLAMTLVGTEHGEIGVLENFLPPENVATK
jgi:Tol biopolymer transport system component